MTPTNNNADTSTTAEAIVAVLATVTKLSNTASDEVRDHLDGAIEALGDARDQARAEDATKTCALCGNDGMVDVKLADEWGLDLLVELGGKLVHTDCWEDESEEG